MHPLQRFEKRLLEIIRMDLQLHFFWSFSLTILAPFWKPLIYSGLLITIFKEILDITAKKGWSWGDIVWGLCGFVAGVVFLYSTGFRY